MTKFAEAILEGLAHFSLTTSSIIYILYPLTKESDFTNNHAGHNYGGSGTVETVKSFDSSRAGTTNK